uniref:NFAM1 Ig-like domain-containing protein n=1 Tax=Salvator merianae TaxID=96440 RepID=A0A8D0C5S5_SALMN
IHLPAASVFSSSPLLPSASFLLPYSPLLSGGEGEGSGGCVIKATCQTVFIYNKEDVKFTVSYNWIDSKGNEVLLEQTTVSENVPPDRQNQSATKDYSFTILPTKHNSNTGTYYCKAKWKKKTRKGNGTFIMFRGKY